MKTSIGLIAALIAFSTPALAQRGDDKKKDQPPPTRRAEPAKKAPAPVAPVVHAQVPTRGPTHVEPPKVAARDRRDEPQRAEPQRAEPQRLERRAMFRDQPGRPDAPHVHLSGNVWIGHDHGRDDPRFRLQRPFEHGRFNGRIGSSERWHLQGGAPGRFYIGAGYFRVARWEYGYVDNWYWDRDEILIYDDPDSEGWYIAYNVRMQTYVHVVFLGN